MFLIAEGDTQSSKYFLAVAHDLQRQGVSHTSVVIICALITTICP